jgi:demethylmenaquinone methyltransferase/2-methoxy-6-polyprenyl-1,4-benzoquinol methylase
MANIPRYGPGWRKNMSEPRLKNKSPAEETHFGFQTVPLRQKQHLVDDVFHQVAARYDLMNDLMSGGLHRLWKDRFVAKLALPRARRARHLDLAGGTGDIAFRILKKPNYAGEVTILDINGDMLAVGRERAMRQHLPARLNFIEANAEDLPFASNSFDTCTIAFGIRNVPRIEKALSEIHRVLKHGGQFLCLEFSNVTVPGLNRIYEAYSFHAIPRIGRLVAGDEDAYRYLVESIRQFPAAETFAAMIEKTGFARVSFSRMSGGIVAIHSGWKL